MKLLKKSLAFTALMAFGLGVAACGSSGGGNDGPSGQDPVPADAFKLSTEEVNILQGTNETVSISTDGKNHKFTWTSSDSDVASVQYRDNMAMISALEPGTCTITVEVDGPEISRSMEVTVDEYVHVEVPLVDEHPDGFIDYAHNGSCTLALDYDGVDFFKDGVGEVELWMTIDGDTAHFTPLVTTTSDETIKARFYGIDTPESTGRIQPYGKQASNFTKDKLKHAAENGTIVVAGVSSAYAKPETDANGRYLCCVWIHETKKHAPREELVNLNLWIIQEGLSDPGSVTKMPDYEEVFVNANAQAKACKLKKYSGKDDPLFPKNGYSTTIPDIMKQVYQYLDGETDVDPFENAVKYTFKGTVVGFANNGLFLQAYDLIEDRYYGVYCFCGMQSIPKKYTKVGNYLEVTGYAQNSENFGFQVTGLEGHFPQIESAAHEDDVHILIKAEDNTADATKVKDFTFSASTLSSSLASREYLHSGIKLTTNLKVNYFNASKDEKKYTLGFEGVNFDLYLTSAFKGNPDNPNELWTTEEQFMGKTLQVNRGILSYHKTTSGNIRYQLVIDDMTQLVCVG